MADLNFIYVIYKQYIICNTVSSSPLLLPPNFHLTPLTSYTMTL